MFNRKQEHEYIVIDHEGNRLSMSDDVYNYIQLLKSELAETKEKNQKLRLELDTIKPVIKSGKLSEAVSSNCVKCKYVIRSTWNHDILGCCKDSVCSDYIPKEG